MWHQSTEFVTNHGSDDKITKILILIIDLVQITTAGIESRCITFKDEVPSSPSSPDLFNPTFRDNIVYDGR